MPDIIPGTGSAGTPLTLSDIIALMGPSIQNVTPTTGQTVVMTDDNKDGTLRLTPAGTLATLTITLPTDANSRIGQQRAIYSTQQVTALTMNGATVMNAVSMLEANDHFTFEKVAANTWALTQ